VTAGQPDQGGRHPCPRPEPGSQLAHVVEEGGRKHRCGGERPEHPADTAGNADGVASVSARHLPPQRDLAGPQQCACPRIVGDARAVGTQRTGEAASEVSGARDVGGQPLVSRSAVRQYCALGADATAGLTRG